MKRAVSVSLGSSTRDKKVEVDLLGEHVVIERIGTDGDEAKAREMFRDLDGKVDAFGVGGIDLGVGTPWKKYPLYGAVKLVQDVKTTPYVDGGGLKDTLETKVMQYVHEQLGDVIQPKTAFLVAGITRYGMTTSFINAGYECVFGDLMFGLGIPIAIRGIKRVERVARILLPIVGRMPISMLYPTGEKQLEVTPKYEVYYQGNSVTAGDWLYIKNHLPEDMQGKIIVTNTTTPDDVEFLKKRGVKYLVTTTPVMDGRSFGTNMLEAALVAAAGKGRALTNDELNQILDELGIKPQIRELN
ncbi:MAG: quinate 5-dehydrogenase [Chloroflexi bacterium]|nr:quinate 5-dehydrogenase [Chloroflexota bacterium]MBU1660759.1 quinate 5-dehydrogenase [Chloroflexota bacterium]